MNGISFNQLLSSEQGALLDIIDKLRSYGIHNHVDLPQLIMCGNQSSGKSSVLEAISTVNFLRNTNSCATFATELILRRAPAEYRRIYIRPAPSRDDAEKHRLSTFKPDLEAIHEFSVVIEQAKEHLLSTSGHRSNAFSEDVLCIELSGPDQPHLTIVDLPGFIQTSVGQQDPQDVDIVASLIKSYMANPRSIILAILAANNDLANQVVFKEIREHDPTGKRTLGIITKPDRASRKEAENAVELAQNKTFRLDLGWHILKNRDDDSENCTNQERADRESAFFSQSPWTELPKTSLGISTLKPMLCTLFLDKIYDALPAVVQEIREGVYECEQTLARLGEPRPGAREQRQFLLDVTRQFEAIVSSAIDGTYREPRSCSNLHPFFKDADPGTKLRAIVRKSNTAFALEVKTRGRRQVFANEDVEAQKKAEEEGNPYILRDQYFEELKIMVEENRGMELPGTFNPLLVGRLFRAQSANWHVIANSHIEETWSQVNTFLELAMHHVASPEVADELLGEYLYQRMAAIRSTLKSKLNEIMKPYNTYEPMTYDDTISGAFDLSENNRLARFIDENATRAIDAFAGENGPAEKPLKLCLTSNEIAAAALFQKPDMTLSLPDKLYKLEDDEQAYYKVAVRTFIDNVAALVIENCLVSELPNLLNPIVVAGMTNEELEQFAGEHEDIKTQRETTERRLAVLRDGQQLCAKYAARAPTAMRQSLHKPRHKAFDYQTPAISQIPPTPALRESSPQRTPERRQSSKSLGSAFACSRPQTPSPSRGRRSLDEHSVQSTPDSHADARSHFAFSASNTPSARSTTSTNATSAPPSPMPQHSRKAHVSWREPSPAVAADDDEEL